MNDNTESLEEWDRWADEYAKAIRNRTLPWEPEPWNPDFEEPLSLAAVFYALMAIRNGKSHRQKPGSLQRSRAEYFDSANWEEVNRPPEDAVRILTRALQAGRDGRELIKKALDLKPSAKGAILARHVARHLTKPKGGWPSTDEEWIEWDRNRETREWIRPTKHQVERALEEKYPQIYKELPKKSSEAKMVGGQRLRPEFWKDSALNGMIDQARGNQ